MLSAGGVLVVLPSLPVLGLTIGGEGIICCAMAMAFGGRTGGGIVDCDRGEEVVFAVKFDEFVLCGFLTEGSACGGVSWTGDSCGDNSELMSILDSSSMSIINDSDSSTASFRTLNAGRSVGYEECLSKCTYAAGGATERVLAV